MIDKAHSISLLVANRPGVLVRIALVFSRRGYNIDSLVVSPTLDPNFSRMNIIAHGNPEILMAAGKTGGRSAGQGPYRHQRGGKGTGPHQGSLHSGPKNRGAAALRPFQGPYRRHDRKVHDYPDYRKQRQGGQPEELAPEIRNRGIYSHGQGHHAPRRRQNLSDRSRQSQEQILRSALTLTSKAR